MRGSVPLLVSLCASFAFVACDGALEAGVAEGSASASKLAVSPPVDGALAERVLGDDDFLPLAAAHPVAIPADAPPYLVSRFGPSQGAAGTHVRILTAFDPSGCSASGACEVTIGGSAVLVADDAFLLEVVVPRGATTGPLCVTWQGRTECGEAFNVLIAALIYESTPGQVAAGAGDTTIALTGDGFMADSEVWFDGSSLATTVHSAYDLTAVVPASALATAGTRALTVYSPSSGRCGALSLPQDFVVE